MGPLSKENQRWNGSLRKRFEKQLQFKTFAVLPLVSGEATQLLSRIMDISQAATLAAHASSNALEKIESNNNKKGGFGDASKVLPQLQIFDVGDPPSFQHGANWLIYGDNQCNDLIKRCKEMDELCLIVDC